MTPAVILTILFSIGLAGTRFVYRPEMGAHFGVKLWLSAVACLAAGFVFDQFAFFMAVVLVAFLATTTSRLDALCRCVILCAVLPNPVWPVRLGNAYLFDLPAVGVLMFAALIVILTRARPSDRTVRGFQAADALALTIIVIFGFLHTRDYTATGAPRTVMTAVFAFILPYLVMRFAVRSPNDVRHVIASFAGAAMILSVIALYETTFGWSLYETIRRNLVHYDFLSQSLRIRGGFMRAPTAFPESTSFAVFQMLGVLATIAAKPFFRSSLLWLGGLSLTLLGLLTAQSRGAYIGLLAGIAVSLLLRRRYGLVATFAAVAAVGVSAVFVAAETNQRAASFIGSNQSYGEFNDYRELLLRRGVQEGLKHPFLGDDVNDVISRMPELVQGEHIVDLVNSYVTIFLASGFVGLSAFFVFLLATLAKLRAASRPKLADEGRIALLAYAGAALAAWALVILFTSFHERNPLWFFMLLACVRPLVGPRQSVVGKKVNKTISGFAGAAIAPRHA